MAKLWTMTFGQAFPDAITHDSKQGSNETMFLKFGAMIKAACPQFAPISNANSPRKLRNRRFTWAGSVEYFRFKNFQRVCRLCRGILRLLDNR